MGPKCTLSQKKMRIKSKKVSLFIADKRIIAIFVLKKSI